jgi:hypothetical protein
LGSNLVIEKLTPFTENIGLHACPLDMVQL